MSMSISINRAPAFGGFVQNFEADTSGVFSGVLSGGDYGFITRVASGTGGIVTADGGDYALVAEPTPFGADSTGPFTRFDGYRHEFINGLTASVDVYLNVGWADGSGFEYSVAASNAAGPPARLHLPGHQGHQHPSTSHW